MSETQMGLGPARILAEGGPTTAFNYVVNDDSAVSGTTYTYRLIEILADSSENLLENTTVSVIDTPTNTPVVFSGSTGDSGSQNPGSGATATSAPATATNVPPATLASAPAATVSAPTPLPTNTPESAAQQNSVDEAAAPPPAAATSAALFPADEAAAPVPAESEESNAENIVRGALGEVPVVEAQEINEAAPPESYPAPQVEGETAEPSTDPPQAQPVEPLQMAAQAAESSPIVIAGANNAAEDNEGAADTMFDGDETQEPESQSSSRILLWIAFLVALIIFSASVIGAILLYSRRRPMK